MVKRYQKKNHVPTSFLHKNLIKKCSGPNTPVLPWRAGKIGGKIDHSRPSDQKWLFNYLPSHLTFFFFFGKVIPMSWGSRGSETDFFFSPSKMSWTQLDNDHRVGCSWSLPRVQEGLSSCHKFSRSTPAALCRAISMYIFGNDIFCWVGTISVGFRFFFLVF